MSYNDAIETQQNGEIEIEEKSDGADMKKKKNKKK